MRVRPIRPNTLKLTHKSVLWVRQIASFKVADKKKNSAKRNVRTRQPSSVIFQAAPIRDFKNRRFARRPEIRTVPKMA